MTSVDVIIPWTDTAQAERHKALIYIVNRLPSILDFTNLFIIEATAASTPSIQFPIAKNILIDEPWNKSRLINLAVKDWCKSTWIFMLDGDIILDKNLNKTFQAIAVTEKAFKPFNRIFRLSKEETAAILNGAPLPIKPNYTSVSVFGGGAFGMRRDVFLSLRGMDEQLSYMEDTDFGYRVLKSDIRVAHHSKPGYHLWHPLVNYQKQKYKNIFRKKIKLSLKDMLLATRSCIPA